MGYVVNLYFVRADAPADIGMNLDLLVEAESVEQATALWRDWSATVVDLDEPIDPEYVGLVPLTGAAGAIPWEKIS